MLGNKPSALTAVFQVNYHSGKKPDRRGLGYEWLQRGVKNPVGTH
jgi:hypothetical protein